MLDNLIEMMMNCWGVVWQYEGVFIQLGGIWTRSQETSVFVTWTGAYCDIFCNKFHGACNLKYILCWNWIGKKRIKRNWNEKKNKEKIFEMIESCLFIVDLKFLFILSQWLGHTLKKQPDLVYEGTTWNKHPLLHAVVFTVGKQDCQVVKKQILLHTFFTSQELLVHLWGVKRTKNHWLVKMIPTINIYFLHFTF